MSKFSKSYTLKQHTPMVHFQSGQRGATLRATELKPKLDKFLLEREPSMKRRKNANGHESLDYKVTIVASDTTINETTVIDARGREQNDPLFFGNMGDGEKKKFVTSKKITIDFLSMNPDIINAIENNFEAFLAITNFGTRQSKGFGSFYLADKTFNPALIPYKVYRFKTSNWKQDIKLFYSFLRQGLNFPQGNDVTRFYSKPAIFTYMVRKNITWDKKAVKRHFFQNDLKNQQEKHSENSPVHYEGETAYLVRDLFGLSTDQKWRIPYNVDIKKEHQEIQRFKSPVTFKIIDNTVYFWADRSVEKMLNQTFKIKIKGKPDLDLNTPPAFDFDDFFAYAFAIDLSKHIAPQFHKQNEYLRLTQIFNELKGSK